MNASVSSQQSQIFRPNIRQHSSYQSLYKSKMGSYSADGGLGSFLAGSAFNIPPCSVIIRKLPSNTTTDTLRSMVVWSKEFSDAKVLSADKSEDAGYRSAILRFKTSGGAMEAKNLLDGKLNISNDAQMIVDLYRESTTGRRYTVDVTANGPAPSTSTSSTASSTGPPPRQSSRFNGSFQSSQRLSPTNNGHSFTNKELPNPENSTHYQSLFSPQSPIGNHLNDRGRISGKSLINNDSVEDDETGELLKDPVAYAENGSTMQGRRPANSQLPVSRMTGLSLNTGNSRGPGPMSAVPQQPAALGPVPHSSTISPATLTNGGPPINYQLGSQHYQRHNFPPVNPADQNPPCNTLYVGNLPIDTSEDELKAMFSKQRGYKRLCFRTKQNGPMCFVEFEDVSFATKALHELYGHPLHNSIKGGIRLSFSKNPLGVRSGHAMASVGPPSVAGIMHGMNGLMLGPGSSFSATNGPPPGLVPPGLTQIRAGSTNGMNSMNAIAAQYAATAFPAQVNGWTSSAYPGAMNTGGSATMMNPGGNGYAPPAYMMGR